MIGPFPMVISNGVAKNASDVFNVLDDDTGGSKAFSVQLSNDGGATLTHWAAYTPLQGDVENALRNMTTQEFKAFVDQKAIEKGRAPVGSVTAFKGSLQMGQAGEDPWAYIASLGLTVVQEALVEPKRPSMLTAAAMKITRIVLPSKPKSYLGFALGTVATAALVPVLWDSADPMLSALYLALSFTAISVVGQWAIRRWTDL